MPLYPPVPRFLDAIREACANFSASGVEETALHHRTSHCTQVEGPFLTPEEREAGYSLQRVRFLKRKYTFEDNELRISIDPKYVKKLTEVLELDKKHSRKPKQTPCTSSSSEPDNSASLVPAEAATYRSAVGMLLYIAHDRPDIQFAVRSLSCGMKEPTERSSKSFSI